MSPGIVLCWTVSISLLTASATASAATPPVRPPHIVLVVVDDLGFDDASLRGSSQIPTPNLDALAFTGVPLGRYYVHAICTPSRAALLTGRLPTHTGLQTDVIYAAEPYGLGLHEKLLPEYLAPLGYSCHAVGKWHLGFFRQAYTPTRRGFRSHLGYWTGHGDYYDHTAMEGALWGLDLRRDLRPVTDQLGNYSTDLFTSEAERLIAAHNASRPLFLYLAHQAVHAGNAYAPLQAPPAASERFPWIGDQRRRTFAGALSELDRSVGRVVTALSQAGLLNDSVLVITTDNGGPVGGVDNNVASNWPLRGGKYTLWEGGVRGTALVWSPRLAHRSRVFRHTFHITDWLPTLYEAAGGRRADLPATDGVSQWAALAGAAPAPAPARTLVLHNIDPSNNYSALLDGRHKLIHGQPFPYNAWYAVGGRNSSGVDLFSLLTTSAAGRAARQLGITVSRAGADSLRRQLAVSCGQRPARPAANCSAGCVFDVVNDPCEYTDLSAEQPQLRRRLDARLRRYWRTMVPSRKVPADPRADPKHWGYSWTYWVDLLST